MDTKEQYITLVNNLNSIKTLNSKCIENIEQLKLKLNEGIVINDAIFNNTQIDKIFNDITKINNVLNTEIDNINTLINE